MPSQGDDPIANCVTFKVTFSADIILITLARQIGDRLRSGDSFRGNYSGTRRDSPRSCLKRCGDMMETSRCDSHEKAHGRTTPSTGTSE